MARAKGHAAGACATIIMDLASGLILPTRSNERTRKSCSFSNAVSVSREGEEIFSTEVTLVRVDGEGRKQSLPKGE